MSRRASTLMLAALVVVVPLLARAQSDRPFPRPALAEEDTLPLPVAVLPDYLVEAERVGLQEILRRVADGEARRDAAMRDQAYTMVGIITFLDRPGDAKAKRKREVATRVYKKRPDLYREIPLRTSGDEEIEISANPGMGEQIASFAFEADERGRYDFRILGRQILGGRIVYEIGYAPKSRFDALPTGRAWVETHDYVVIRQEFSIRQRSPAPLFLARIDTCVVERQRLEGRYWVLRRVLARVTLSAPARTLGRVAMRDIPRVVDFAASTSDWEINRGIDDAFFEPRGRR